MLFCSSLICIIAPIELNLGNPLDAGSVKSFILDLDAYYVMVTYVLWRE